MWCCSRPQTPISEPDFDAALFIAIVNMLYLMGTLAVVTAFSKSMPRTFFENIGRIKLFGLIFAIGAFSLHEYFYVWSGNAKKIVKEFKNTNVTMLGTAAVLVYMVFAFIFFIAAGILLSPSVREQLPKF
jgi:hypothetical protein